MEELFDMKGMNVELKNVLKWNYTIPDQFQSLERGS